MLYWVDNLYICSTSTFSYLFIFYDVQKRKVIARFSHTDFATQVCKCATSKIQKQTGSSNKSICFNPGGTEAYAHYFVIIVCHCLFFLNICFFLCATFWLPLCTMCNAWVHPHTHLKLNFGRRIAQFSGKNISKYQIMFLFIHSHVFEPKNRNDQHVHGSKTQRSLPWSHLQLQIVLSIASHLNQP